MIFFLDKRSLLCPKRHEWVAARDKLHEGVKQKVWNPKLNCFGQSYEETDISTISLLLRGSYVLITMTLLAFFMQPVRSSFKFVEVRSSLSS